jgi:hypothetical protein
MKKTIIYVLLCTLISAKAMAQVPVLNPNGNVDGLRIKTPTQAGPKVITPALIKPALGLNFGTAPCNSAGNGTTKFKSIALNTRNGGVWLIDENDILTGCHNHFAQLQGGVGSGTTQNESKVQNLTSYRGVALVNSLDGLGMMSGGHPAPHVRNITQGMPGFPMPTTKYVYGDVESPDEVWYLNEKGYIRPASSSTTAANTPPEKFAKMFTVYNRRFIMTDENQDLYMWKPGFKAWQKMGSLKAKHMTTDQGLSSVLWYVGTDDQVYYLHTEEPTPQAMNAKAKSIAVFGSQLYYIGLDGYFYLRVGQKDIRVAL